MINVDIAKADSVGNSNAAHVVAALDLNCVKVLEQIRKSLETPVTYEFTKDPFFLEQYYKIREKCYREDLLLDDFSGEEDEYDRIGSIVVARKGEQVIGGARVEISTPENRIRLPLEEEGFLVADLFPELHLQDKSYCEFTRFVVRADYRGTDLCQEITRKIIEHSTSAGCLYQFSIAPILQARNSRMIGKRLGVLHVIRNDIKVPFKKLYRHLNKQRICLSVTYFYPEMASNKKTQSNLVC